jgi:hypothetical protein
MVADTELHHMIASPIASPTSVLASPPWRLLVAVMLFSSPFLGVLAWEFYHCHPANGDDRP